MSVSPTAVATAPANSVSPAHGSTGFIGTFTGGPAHQANKKNEVKTRRTRRSATSIGFNDSSPSRKKVNVEEFLQRVTAQHASSGLFGSKQLDRARKKAIKSNESGKGRRAFKPQLSSNRTDQEFDPAEGNQDTSSLPTADSTGDASLSPASNSTQDGSQKTSDALYLSGKRRPALPTKSAESQEQAASRLHKASSSLSGWNGLRAAVAVTPTGSRSKSLPSSPAANGNALEMRNVPVSPESSDNENSDTEAKPGFTKGSINQDHGRKRASVPVRSSKGLHGPMLIGLPSLAPIVGSKPPPAGQQHSSSPEAMIQNRITDHLSRTPRMVFQSKPGGLHEFERAGQASSVKSVPMPESMSLTKAASKVHTSPMFNELCAKFIRWKIKSNQEPSLTTRELQKIKERVKRRLAKEASIASSSPETLTDEEWIHACTPGAKKGAVRPSRLQPVRVIPGHKLQNVENKFTEEYSMDSSNASKTSAVTTSSLSPGPKSVLYMGLKMVEARRPKTPPPPPPPPPEKMVDFDSWREKHRVRRGLALKEAIQRAELDALANRQKTPCSSPLPSAASSISRFTWTLRPEPLVSNEEYGSASQTNAGEMFSPGKIQADPHKPTTSNEHSNDSEVELQMLSIEGRTPTAQEASIHLEDNFEHVVIQVPSDSELSQESDGETCDVIENQTVDEANGILGAEGVDRSMEILSKERQRQDFFEAAKLSLLNKQHDIPHIMRHPDSSGEYGNSVFASLPSTISAEFLQTATTLQSLDLPVLPAMLHTERVMVSDNNGPGTSLNIIKWDHFGFGGRFVQAHKEAFNNANADGISLMQNRLTHSDISAVISPMLCSSKSIKYLNLQGNPIGDVGMVQLAQGLQHANNMLHIDLAETKMSDSSCSELATALKNMKKLMTLILDKNSLKQGLPSLFGELDKSSSISHLSIAWNQLDHISTCAIGNALNSSLQNLRVLDLQWNNCNSHGSEGISALSEGIIAGKQLEYVDLSSNRLTDVPVILIAYAIRRSACMRRVVLDGNPIGSKGGTAVSRAMRCNEAGNLVIDTRGCTQDAPSDIAYFNIKRPDGFWKLDLSKPADRAICSELWEITIRQRGENWIGETLDGRSYDISEDPDKPWMIPSTGILEVNFVSCPAPPKTEDVVKGKLFTRMLNLMKNCQADRGRRDLLVSAAPEEVFGAEQIKEIIAEIGDANEKVETLAALFSRVVDLEEREVFLKSLKPEELRQLANRIGALFHFDPRFPSGRYKLNLEDDNDCDLLIKLKQICFEESKVRREVGRPDLSQDGSGQIGFRNVVLDLVPQEPSYVMKSKRLPLTGIISFDYISARMPTSDSVACKRSVYQSILRTIKNQIKLCIPLAETFLVLRKHYFSAKQLWEISELFAAKEESAIRIFVSGFNLIVDLENVAPLLWSRASVRFRQEVTHRLGWLMIFNPLQIDGFYQLQLEQPDQRIVTEILVDLSVKEPGENWVDETYQGRAFELPVTWVEEVPFKGELTLTYVTHPGCKRSKVRRRHCSKCLIGEVLEQRDTDDPIGEVEIDLSFIHPEKFLEETWFELRGVPSGQVCLRVEVSKDIRGAAVLDTQASMEVTVHLLEAKDLVAMDASGTSDPYAVISLGDETFKSSIQMTTLEPTWNEAFEVSVQAPCPPLTVKIFDHDEDDGESEDDEG